MKNHFRHVSIALPLLALFTLNSQFSTAFAQGSLTPPGAPAPAMKSLDQVEARTIVNAANTPGDAGSLFIISQPGSYYLTTNLAGVSGKSGIEITTNNVTLDLNGFALRGVSGSSNGILIPNASTNITVRNGAVSGWGADGVSDTSASAVNVVCERLNVSSCGSDGIYLNGSGVVRDCNIQKNNNDGIDCPGNGGVLISGCTASANTGNGIQAGNGCTVNQCVASGESVGIAVGSGCTVENCAVSGNIDPYAGAIYSGDDCTIKDCTASANSSPGISAGNNCTVKDCTASGNSDSGILVRNNCAIKDCTASGDAGEGIEVNGNDCQITGNTCAGNGAYGIEISGGQNRVDNNSVGNNTSFGIFPDNINMTNSITRNSSPGAGYGNTAGNNDYAPIGTPNTAASPWENFH